MENQLVTIDIIIPVYNCENYIDRCMKSILNQKSKNNLRIILVNDGSTDNSKEIINGYARKYKNVVAINKSNGGLSSARNAGLELVHSTYFSFVDPDDWVESGYFDLLLKRLQGSKIDILMTPYIRKYEDKELKNLVFGEKDILFTEKNTKLKVLRRLYGLVGAELRHPLTIDNLSTAWAKVYKSSKFNKVRFVDRKKIYSEDLWFNILCFQKAEVTAYFANTFYFYYKNNNKSIVNTFNPEMLNEYMTLYNYMEKEIINNNLPASFNIALNNRIVLNELAILRNANLSNTSYLTKLGYINDILNYPRYDSAYKHFDFALLPVNYRLFYKACKYRLKFLVMFILYFGEKLKKKIKQ